MACFVHMPALKIGGNHTWILESELVYSSDLTEKHIIVPRGFETDLASIPRIVTPIIPINGHHRAPAIVHDYLCRTWSISQRDLADRIFLEAMKERGVERWRRTLMYLAVAGLTQWLKIARRKADG